MIYYTLSFSGRREDSHKLLEAAIAEYTGEKEKAGALIRELKKGKNGKPYIDGFCHFSISHSGSAWAVLFSDRECGLDVQYERECDITSIAERWYDPIDAKVVTSAAEEAADGSEGEKATQAFFRIWTRREALAKAMGGTVYDSSLPSVSDGLVTAYGAKYKIQEIYIPGTESLCAAVCIRKDRDDPCVEKGSGKEFQYTLLRA